VQATEGTPERTTKVEEMREAQEAESTAEVTAVGASGVWL